MMRYLLDTTFVIDYLRGDAAALQRFARFFEDGDDVIVNEIVVCEAATGARIHPDADLEAMLEPLEFVNPGRQHLAVPASGGAPRVGTVAN